VLARIDKCAEFAFHAAVAEFDGCNFDDGFAVFIKPGGFNINGNYCCHVRTSVP